MGTFVDINNLWSILNRSTAYRDISLTYWHIGLSSSLIFMHLQLFLPLTLSSVIISRRWCAWWKSRLETSAQISTWDVLASQVLVHVDDADVFFVFLHHAHHRCEVVIKLSARGRNTSRCIKIRQPARKIRPRVSEIYIFAVMLFRIDQRSLITATFPISILGVSSSCSLPCVHWLWLYDSPRPQRGSLSSWVKLII